MRRFIAGIAVAVVAVVAVGATVNSTAVTKPDKKHKRASVVSVQLLAINDFHGNLEPGAGVRGEIKGVKAGGAEYLAAHLKRDEADNPNSIVVSAGDQVGGSPLLSSLFHQEPAIESLNAMGLEVASVGNHDFDRGKDELLRMQNGGCNPVDGCPKGHKFAGAKFEYLAANAIDATTHKTLFPPYTIKTVGGVKIGFIGETLKETPEESTPHGTDGVSFLSEAPTANKYAKELRDQGAAAVVLLLHQGGHESFGGGPNDCYNLKGPINRIVDDLSDDIDVVLSGHTHQFYNCTYKSKIVTQASSFGRLITKVNLDIDKDTGEVVDKSATNEVVTQDVKWDPAQHALIKDYRALAAPISERVVGSITNDITQERNRAGESALGDLIADSQLEATQSEAKGGADVAFMNSTGIRADLFFDHPNGGARSGQVTFEDIFATEPFGNKLVVMTLTGSQIYDLLAQQLKHFRPYILGVSEGFSYSYSHDERSATPGTAAAAAAGEIVEGSVKLNGKPIKADTKYRVTANEFLANGGSGFSVFADGTDRHVYGADIDALEAYFKKNSPVDPPARDRIERVEGGHRMMRKRS